MLFNLNTHEIWGVQRYKDILQFQKVLQNNFQIMYFFSFSLTVPLIFIVFQLVKKRLIFLRGFDGCKIIKLSTCGNVFLFFFEINYDKSKPGDMRI